VESLVQAKPHKTHILYSQEIIHVQPGPIKLKSIMSTTLKVSGKQSGMISATNMNDATGDVGNVLSERE
jgi:hypothetical protein